MRISEFRNNPQITQITRRRKSEALPPLRCGIRAERGQAAVPNLEIGSLEMALLPLHFSNSAANLGRFPCLPFLFIKRGCLLQIFNRSFFASGRLVELAE